MNDLERLACGVICTGFSGTALTEGEAKNLRARQFAGYVIFGRNVVDLGQLRDLTDSLRALHTMPPLIGVDQEGGRVVRIRDGAETMPSMMALGAADDEQLALHAGERLGFDVRRAGATIDFAPVLDLAFQPANTVIGTRAFGSDPHLVARLGASVARGLERAGIAATFKHFPGHGATDIDSHHALPHISIDLATFYDRHLMPFRACAPTAHAFMTAHIVVDALDEGLPATLSERFLSKVLRDEFKFNGVCFTDCMQMDAIAAGIGTARGVARAIAAGADCAIVSNDAEVAYEAALRIVADVECGTLSRARLEEAYARVQRLREHGCEPLPIDTPAPHPGIGRLIGRRAVTLLRGVARVDPTAAIAISFEGATTEGAQGVHEEHAGLEREAPALRAIRMPLAPPHALQAPLLQQIAESARRPIVLMRRAHVYDEQLATVRAIVARFPDTLVVSLREPYDCALVPEARHVVATYGDDVSSIGGLADVLFGTSPPGGTLPVVL